MVQENSLNNKIIIICGPTASGKTSLAVNLAKELNTEIISADSMLIYKGFDIGTAKPTTEEKQGIKHHLIDIVDGNSSFSVADYRDNALQIVNKLQKNGKIPIICGGTGFYINSILYDFSYGNSSSNTDIRQKYVDFLNINGCAALHDLLKEKDPLSAEKLHQNDTKRVIRALEIYELSGIPKSSYNDKVSSKFDYIALSYDYDRESLYNRINERVDKMLQCGLIDEVENLLKNGVDKNAQAMQGIGYKEVLKYLNGDVSYADTVEEIKRNSRRYAKRQITFFKRLDGLTYLQPVNGFEKSLEIIKNKFGE